MRLASLIKMKSKESCLKFMIEQASHLPLGNKYATSPMKSLSRPLYSGSESHAGVWNGRGSMSPLLWPFSGCELSQMRLFLSLHVEQKGQSATPGRGNTKGFLFYFCGTAWITLKNLHIYNSKYLDNEIVQYYVFPNFLLGCKGGNMRILKVTKKILQALTLHTSHFPC